MAELDPGQDERGKEIVAQSTPSAGGGSSKGSGSSTNSGRTSSESGLGNPNDPIANRIRNERFGGEPFDKWQGQGGLKGKAAKAGSGFAGYMKRHPKGVIWAVVSIVTAIFGFIAFVLSIPFQLLHMANNLLDFNFKVGDRVEQKAAQKVLARLFQDRQFDNGGKKSATGRPIHDKIINMKIEKFNSVLAKNGIELKFDGDGKLTGIMRGGVLETDLKNTSLWERRGAIGDLVSQSIAPWRVLKRVKYTRVMRYHARVSFRFWPAEKVTDVRKLMTEKIRKGASAAELSQHDGKNAAQADQERAAAQQDGRDTAAGAVETVKKTYAETGSKVQAIKAGTKAIRGKLAVGFGITAIISLVCTLRDMANEAVAEGYIERADLLIHAGNVLPTMAHQAMEGDVNLDNVGQTIELFNGQSATKINPDTAFLGGVARAAEPDPTAGADEKSFEYSAAWKRISGEAVDTDINNKSYNPDLSPGANPDGFALAKFMDAINSVFNAIPGASFACSVVNGVFGWILQGIELVAGIISGGATAAVSAVVQGGLSVYFFGVVVPQVLASAASMAVTGSDNSVDLFNNTDAGLALSAQDYLRTMGGKQLNDGQQTQLRAAAEQEEIQIAQEKGWIWRTFAVSNPKSFLSRLVIKIPNSPNRAMAALTNVPHNFASTFNSVFFGLRPAAADIPVAINPYGFQFYGFTDEELDRYDPVENEAVLAAPIPGTDKTRLSMLGDPSKYTPANGDDPNSATDLLHCFVNRYTNQPDPICHGIGKVASVKNGSQADNPTDAEIVADIYCTKNQVCGLAPKDDLLRYRLELLFTHVLMGAECLTTTEDCFAGSSTASAPITVPAGDAQALAKQILASSNITFQQASDRTDMEKVSNGQPVVYCKVNGPFNVSMLRLIVQLQTKYSFSINAIATGHGNCDGKFHDQGRAVDVGNVNGIRANAANLRGSVYKEFAQYAATLLPQGGGLGQKNDSVTHEVCLGSISPTPSRYFDDRCNHIHLDVGESAP